MELSKPVLKVSVFSDYICPFCYVGDARLDGLRDRYDLKVNWCFLEIHPETSPEGEPIASLNYPAATWQRMMARLRQMAEEENLSLRDQDFTTNSR
ncbi:DsbA family oxidoreductase, partial [Thiogranum longum]